jgi:hypothetical protein
MTPGTALRILSRVGRRPPPVLPRLERRLAVEVDPGLRVRMAGWLDLEPSRVALPCVYPLLQPAHVELLLTPSLGISLLGMVHLAQTTAVHDPDALEGRLDLALTLVEDAPLAGRRTVRIGSRLSGMDLVATAESRYLLPGTRAPRTAPASGGGWTSELPPTAPSGPPHRWGAGAGRAYARVSGDWNPIHVAALPARLFGQPGAILHGMAMAAVAWRDLGATARVQEARFRRSRTLPGATTARGHAEGVFEVRDGERILVEGVHRAMPQENHESAGA